MKKALIAGAASVALAAMPVVGVFATADHTDTLNLKINNACTFSRSSDTAHANGSGTTWGTTQTSAAGDADTLYATVVNGESYTNLGTSTFVVTCNNQYGYKVEVDASDFSATGAATNATGEYAWAYAAGGSLTTAGSMWTLSSSKTGDSVDLSNNIVATVGAPVSADTFTITYKAYVDATQPADTYTATAAYTFSQLAQ